MGRHRSRRDSGGRRARSKRRRSSSSSPRGDRRRRNRGVERSEGPVTSSGRRSRSETRGSGVQRGDELMIPFFDPSRDDLVVEKWIDLVEGLADQYGWDNRSILRLIPSRLKGHALQWYDARQSATITWEEMKTTLLKRFRKPVPFCKLFREAALYETHAGQPLGDYCFQKLTKLQKLGIPIPDNHLIDMVIGGITDENVFRTVRAAQHRDADELYAYMSTLGNMPRRGDKSTAPVVPDGARARKERWTKLSRTEVHEDSDKTEDKPATLSDKRTRIEYFNCGEAGHIARKCPKPQTECTRCGRKGHRTEKCFLRKDVNVIRKEERVSSPYVRTVLVNHRRVKGLIDTGSGCTLLRESIAEKCNLKVLPTATVVLRGFAGQVVTCNKTTLVEIRIMGATARVEALVVSGEHLVYDVIIGRDFLDQEHIVTYKRGNVLLFGQIPDDECETIVDANFVNVLSDDTVRTGDIGESAKQECVRIIREYGDCISLSLRDLGKTDAASIEIRCTSDVPVVYRPYRLAEPEKQVVRGIIRELLDNGIIRESNSPYASPILLVKKKDGENRMCVDYRKLNAITIKDKYPMPLIEEQIDKLGGNRYFTGLDLASGYYQVPVAETSIEKTAFVTPEGHYEFLRMPFGLTNAPAVFQRLMDKVLGEMKNSIAFPYLDDVIIPSKTVEEGKIRLRRVLDAFRAHRLTLKLDKCSFFATSLDYLGREISEEGVRPGQRKVEAVLRMEAPRTVKQVRQFLGLASYFRKFIRNFAVMVEPLTRLTKKNEPWVWEAAQENAVKKIKAGLTDRPILTIFDPNKPTEVHTDASSVGVGAVLLQKTDDRMSVVAYYSKQTTTDQRHYHSYELETMAVVFALRHFRVYLLGSLFKVVTDCNALRATFSKRDLLPRIGRWWLEVQEYTFEVEYRAGSKMAHVGALSRNPVPFKLEVLQIDVTEGDWILAAQLQDERLSQIRSILTSGKPTSEAKHYFDDYTIKNGKVYRKLAGGVKAWVVPRNARMQVCRLCHDDAGHLGVEKTVERISRNYWFAGMRRFVKKYVNACLSCAYYKHTPGKKQGKLHVIDKVSVPFHTIHIDHVGPFETSRKRNKFLLVIVDAFTKFTLIEPVRSQKSRHAIKILVNLTYLFGVPDRIISDRGTAFASHAFRTFCGTYGIKHVLNAVATPRTNDQCERYNKTIVQALTVTAAGKDPRDWDLSVKQVQSALNTMHNKSIDTTPMKALIGCDTRSPAKAWILAEIQDEVHRLKLTKLRENVKAHITQEQRAQKERYDRNRKAARVYAEGDLVLVQITSEPATGASRKLLPKFKGPFKVRNVLINDRYEVKDMREGCRRGRTVVAADRIKPWISIQAE